MTHFFDAGHLSELADHIEARESRWLMNQVKDKK
jgi:hypothetical protein